MSQNIKSGSLSEWDRFLRDVPEKQRMRIMADDEVALCVREERFVTAMEKASALAFGNCATEDEANLDRRLRRIGINLHAL